MSKPSRAIVTILEDKKGNGNRKENNILEFLRSQEFINRKSYSAEEIEAQIKENEESWD